MANPKDPIAEFYPTACILFSSLHNFPSSIQGCKIESLNLLHEITCQFDAKCTIYGIEKIKTTGTTFMAMTDGPVSKRRGEPLLRLLKFTDSLFKIIQEINEKFDLNIGLKMGIHTGPVVGGVIGVKKFCFDIWGDSVNVAARLEQYGEIGKIQISKATKERLEKIGNLYDVEERGEINLKGKGLFQTFYLKPRPAYA